MKPANTSKIIIFSFLIAVLAAAGFSFKTLSQTDLEICESIQEIDRQCNALSSAECQALLEKCQNYLAERSSQIAQDISKTEKEKKTLQNAISLLRNRIRNLNYQISQGNLVIKDLGIQIKDTQSSIDKTSLKIDESTSQLADVLRTVYEEDKKSLIEIMLEGNLSDFFDNLVYLENLNGKLADILANTQSLKVYLEDQKQEMDVEKDDLERTVKVQTIQKQQSESLRKEQEQVLKMTEAQYQKSLKDKAELDKIVSEITSRIAQLTLPGLEVPRTKKELYELASWASGITGVRASLILGLIEVESALGINVGQCNCSGQPSCRHPELTYKQVMSSKQWASFEAIVTGLNLNINSTPVSCFVDGGRVQMGGAMGPAQFMPNTWLNLGYKQRVESVIGQSANPWRARDAFLAAALYLSDFNAATQKRQSELGAVTAYLCGTSTMTRTCKNSGGEWYRNLVMQKTDNWQRLIDQGI